MQIGKKVEFMQLFLKTLGVLLTFPSYVGLLCKVIPGTLPCLVSLGTASSHYSHSPTLFLVMRPPHLPLARFLLYISLLWPVWWGGGEKKVLLPAALGPLATCPSA